MTGIYLQLALAWCAANVIFAMRSVLKDAAWHSWKKGEFSNYLLGAFSIIGCWIGGLMMSLTRVNLMAHGTLPIGIRTATGNLAMWIFILSGWCACRVGLPKRNGPSIAWWTFNTVLSALIIMELVK